MFPAIIRTQYVNIISIRTSTLQLITHMHCSRTRDGPVEVLYVLREGPVLQCDALSRKETDYVNKHMRQALSPGEQAKVGMKHSATCGSYTDYVPN